jgi:outer membrane biosynthesis protein TonB
MIDRILVPIDARPPATIDTPTQRRRPTTLDERTLVPAMLPIVTLDGHSTIPTNLPLESIAARVVVPRDVSREAYGVTEDTSIPLQPTDMDERIVLPQGAAPPDTADALPIRPTDMIAPDIFITGEVQLIAPPASEEKTKWQVVTRISSIAFHVLVIAAILLQSKLFPKHAPTQEEMDLAQRQMVVLLPPGALDALKPTTRPAQPAPKVNVDPRVLRKVAPPIEPTPAPAAQPERPVKELPSAPVPKTNVAQTVPQTDAPTPKAPLKLETPDTPQPRPGLLLPTAKSPGESIQESLRNATKSSGPRPIAGGGAIPGGGSGGGGGGRGTAYGGIEMLTPDEGVDFSNYLNRVYVTVKRNWFAVMPGSVELGEKGIVVLTFKIMRDGSVPSAEPVIQRNSGKEPLDRAAYSSVRASNPFEPLPPQFSGPYIELRYTYLYNIPPEYLNQLK